MSVLAHPLMQSVVIPAAVSAALLAVLAACGARRQAAAVVPAAAALAALAVAGGIQWPPLAALQKLPLLLAACAIAGMLGERWSTSWPRRIAPVLAVAAAGTAWLAWPQRLALSPSVVPVLAGGLVLAVAVVVRTSRRADEPAAAGVVLAVASAGLAAVAVIDGSLALGQLGVALACAAGVFSASALVMVGAAVPGSGAGAWVLLAVATALLTDVGPWPLALLATAFLADAPWRRAAGDSLVRIGLCGLSALLPVLAAVGVAAWSDAPSGPYYR